MTPATASTRSRPLRRPARGSRRRAVRRRRLLALALGVGSLAAVVALVLSLVPLDRAVREITLPLRHEDIIRQQASDKRLDPALIAAVIYEESKFRDQTSPAGAKGLMQITPQTAEYIAHKSGGVRFEQGDLATPQINISYGAFYLRYLLDRYDGNEELAIAAYNGGETNVDRWVHRAGGPDAFDSTRDIPFTETRSYVEDVFERRGEYRERYGRELGL